MMNRMDIERRCAPKVSEFHLHGAQHAVRVDGIAAGRRCAEKMMGCHGVLVEDVDSSDVCERGDGRISNGMSVSINTGSYRCGP
jgi:hypothetical protein